MTYIPGADYHVFWIPFPKDNGTDGGAVIPNQDDDGYSIYLDARLLSNMEKAKIIFDHERKHIEDEDFWNGKPIKEIEDI